MGERHRLSCAFSRGGTGPYRRSVELRLLPPLEAWRLCEGRSGPVVALAAAAAAPGAAAAPPPPPPPLPAWPPPPSLGPECTRFRSQFMAAVASARVCCCRARGFVIVVAPKKVGEGNSVMPAGAARGKLPVPYLAFTNIATGSVKKGGNGFVRRRSRWSSTAATTCFANHLPVLRHSCVRQAPQVVGFIAPGAILSLLCVPAPDVPTLSEHPDHRRACGPPDCQRRSGIRPRCGQPSPPLVALQEGPEPGGSSLVCPFATGVYLSDEANAAIVALFQQIDGNSDGALTVEDFHSLDAWQVPAVALVIALLFGRVGFTGLPRTKPTSSSGRRCGPSSITTPTASSRLTSFAMASRRMPSNSPRWCRGSPSRPPGTRGVDSRRRARARD